MSTNNVQLHAESNLSQQLNLAPQLLNWLRLLQASSLDLEQIVRTELIQNPVLENAEADFDKAEEFNDEVDFDYEQEISMTDDSVADRLSMLADIDNEWRDTDTPPALMDNNSMREKYDYMIDHVVQSKTLQEELAQSIAYSDMDAAESSVALSISGSIDERGYLSDTPVKMAEDMGVEYDFFRRVLDKFQQIAPPGIGAENLQQCLLAQLRAIPQDTSFAQTLVSDWLTHLAQGQEQALADHLKVDTDQINDAVILIRSLDPEPGRYYNSTVVEYVNADLEFYEEDGDINVRLCDANIPRLSISKYCKKLLEAKQGSKEDLEYIRQKILSANFLIQGITQRQETLLKVGQQILRVQREYLLKPAGQLKVLTMNKVAAIIGVHETTVSRAIANKYVQTPKGLTDMRTFFKVGYRCADGSFITPERIKERMKTLVNGEDALLPLTDLQISEVFKKDGVKVARRTVAKYREEMGIPSSKERLAKARASKTHDLAVAV